MHLHLKYIKMSYKKNQTEKKMLRRSCLLDALASVWVDFYHAAFVGKHALEKEQQMIRMSLVHKELQSCHQKLSKKEADLQARIDSLTKEAIARKNARDMAGAKKKMLERRHMQAQLEKLQNTITTINMQQNTLEGTELDRTVLETMKAYGDAMRQIGASTSGIKAVEEIVADVEQQMQDAAEVTRVLAAGSVTGMVNTMAVDGIIIDEDELMHELDEMMLSEEDIVLQKQPQPDLLLELPSPGTLHKNNNHAQEDKNESSSIRSILQMQ